MKKSKILIIFLVFIILIVSMFISLKIGSIEITFKELIDGMFFGNNEGNISCVNYMYLVPAMHLSQNSITVALASENRISS